MRGWLERACFLRRSNLLTALPDLHLTVVAQGYTYCLPLRKNSAR